VSPLLLESSALLTLLVIPSICCYRALYTIHLVTKLMDLCFVPLYMTCLHSRQYSLETGAPPRDLLRRRVRVAEYYRIPWSDDFFNQTLNIHVNNAGAGGAHIHPNHMNPTFGSQVLIDLYDESKDTFFTITWQELLLHAALDEEDRCAMLDSLQGHNAQNIENALPQIANEEVPNPFVRSNFSIFTVT
jgi:hypothetical protein